MTCRVASLVLVAVSSAFAGDLRKPLRDLNGEPLHEGAVARFGSTARVKGSQDFTFSPDGKLAAWTTHEQVRVWDLTTGRERCRLMRPATDSWDVAVLTDGLLIADSETVRVIDLSTTKTLRIL